MSKIRLLCLLLVAVAPTYAMAQSAVLSINHVVTHNMPFDQCLRHASDTFRVANMRQFGTTSEAVWAETADRRYSATIYCLTTRDVAVVAVYGPDRRATASILDNLLEAWRRVR
ncbi:MAG: hypothetical protein WAN86_17670 [Hyphomicrobiaceae bacterium]